MPFSRRATLSAIAGVAATAALGACGRSSGSTPAAAATPAPSATPSAEPNLSATDPSLEPRARALVRIGEEGIARENQAALEAFFATDFVFHGPDGGSLTREQLWDYFAACRRAFDDFQVTRQQFFSDGGALAGARTTFSGIFARRFDASPIGPLEPTGARAMYRINNVFRYHEDGKLAEEWAQYDSRLFLETLGVRLVPAGPRAS
ncbi:hypothetical protein Aab01nite_81120 [Paractinoplanes abujensis]|uniref:Putative ester cyclase n=1 Tax=Paractinoplanes abujensis TaxID=882441 RepID=A0A7W7CTY9_9ACTN|nr:ester cyclase [Actinoplanes abujensis]MBB4693320.1 putative ester cyclase [Actinoplanes abujensis]GID24522.1 hypothetical protein Aab01nite_81120 [Actinoplanes abujensis]